MTSDVDTVRRWYATRAPELLDPEVEWRVLETFPAGGTYRGREAVLDRFFPALAARFDELAAVPEDFLAAEGEAVLVTGRYRGRAKDGASPLSVPFAHLWRLRGGRIRAFEQFADTALMEAALRPSSRGPG